MGVGGEREGERKGEREREAGAHTHTLTPVSYTHLTLPTMPDV